jgi:hypothetical protein
MKNQEKKRRAGGMVDRPGKGALAVAVVILLCGVLALTAEEKKKIVRKTQPSTSMNPTAPVSSLPATIKLAPGELPGLISLECREFSSAVYQAWEKVKNNFEALAQRFAEQNMKYEEACMACKNKTYTQQEMAAAGCLPTDTVAQCSQKLFNRCVNSISMAAGFLLLCGNVMDMSKASKEFENAFFHTK